jgi:hypothetical protein
VGGSVGTVRRRPRAVRAPAKTGVARATNGRKTAVEVPGGGAVLQWPVVARDGKLVAQTAMAPRRTTMVSVGGGGVACAVREERRPYIAKGANELTFAGRTGGVVGDRTRARRVGRRPADGTGGGLAQRGVGSAREGHRLHGV